MQVLLSLRSSDIEAETWRKRRAATFLGNHGHRSMVAICCYHCLNNSVLDISEENNGKYLNIGYNYPDQLGIIVFFFKYIEDMPMA